MNVIRKIKNEILYYNKENHLRQGIVRPEIIESWKRSRDYGLDPKNCRFGVSLSDDIFNNVLQEKEYLIRAAEPFIQHLETFLNSDDVVLLVDEQGVVLYGNTLNTDVLYKLRPGVMSSEKIIGTCAHVLCMIHKRPIQVRGSEHYCEVPELEEPSKHGVCSSAPIFNERGEFAGTISIGNPNIKSQNLHTLSLVVSIADAIQKQISLEIKNKLFDSTIESIDEAIVAIDSQGVITEMNTEARRMFNCPNNIIGMHINDVLGNISLLRSLDTGKSLVDTKLKIASLNKSVYLSVARPIGDNMEYKMGSILTFRNYPVKGAENSLVPNETKFSFENIIGESPAIIKSVQMAMKFSPSNANILLQGESGTGKEVYAQAIHNNSRPAKPFIAVNCAAIPENLIESELFGYESGAFTGAERKGNPGKFELASGGTLFLDEIGDMPLKLQPVLLRVLEEKKVTRLGGSRNIPADFRLIAATNKNLKELVANLQFREDLYYRVAVFKISIPPLRERGTDIIKLAKHFIEVSAKQLQVPAPVLNYATIEQLLNYAWPGNVRQLENAMYYAVNMAEDGTILPDDLPDDITDETKGHCYEKNSDSTKVNDMLFRRSKFSLKEAEKTLICEALAQTERDVGFAAQLLGLSKSTLYRKIKEYNLED